MNIYGVFYAEYSKINQGNTAPSVGFPGGVALRDRDHLQNPGSAIGFRGEEKLGSGLSAWFQCESTADFRGQSSEGFCARNSALGLKGGFGNVFMGNWDTPFKRVQEATGSGDTGVFGSAWVLMGNRYRGRTFGSADCSVRFWTTHRPTWCSSTWLAGTRKR